jgi:hypothetical protein
MKCRLSNGRIFMLTLKRCNQRRFVSAELIALPCVGQAVVGRAVVGQAIA